MSSGRRSKCQHFIYTFPCFLFHFQFQLFLIPFFFCFEKNLNFLWKKKASTCIYTCTYIYIYILYYSKMDFTTYAIHRIYHFCNCKVFYTNLNTKIHIPQNEMNLLIYFNSYFSIKIFNSIFLLIFLHSFEINYFDNLWWKKARKTHLCLILLKWKKNTSRKHYVKKRCICVSPFFLSYMQLPFVTICSTK